MPKPTTTEKFVVTKSRLNAFAQCPQKEFFQYRAGGVGVKSTQPYLPFIEGELGHWAIAMFRRHGQMMVQRMENRVKKMIKEATQAANGLDQQVVQKMEVSLARMVAACMAYKDVYKSDLDEFEWLHIEEPFEITSGGVTIAGVMDGVAKRKSNGNIALFENKFVSSITTETYASLPMTFDQWVYLIACKKFLGRLPDEYVWDMTVKSQHRLRQKETISEFRDRLIEEYVKPREHTNVMKYFFRPPPFKISAKEVNNANVSILAQIKHMQNGPCYMNFGQCTGMYGKLCEFVPACQAILAGHKSGWNAPQCRGLFKVKDSQHEEVEAVKKEKK